MDERASVSAAAKTPSKSAHHRGSVKETIESILVAFILAFIFRAFVVEAFVIPTGSMAPTLLGAHMRYRCDDCGYQFTTNFSSSSGGSDEIYIPAISPSNYERIYCPNCGYKIPLNSTEDRDNDGAAPSVSYGDRILVLKYLYLLEQPKRWDVVVFKTPDNPAANHYQTNYIKRLVGKPGESVLILDGDVYVGQGDTPVTDFSVQTKPRYVQEALWRIVYDNDYYPRNLGRPDGVTWRQPWIVRDGEGWNLGKGFPDGRVFRFDNKSGASTLTFDRTANPMALRKGDAEPWALTDWLAYDTPYPERDERYQVLAPRNVVHDLKLTFFYDRQAGDGPLRVKLTNGNDAFIGVVSATEAKLLHVRDGVEKQIGSAMPLSRSSSPIRVELANADYQVTFRVDETDVAQTAPDDYRPDIAALLDAYQKGTAQPYPSVEISADRQTAALSHISLWRDIYYTNRQNPGQPSTPVWAVPRNLPDSLMRLGEEEYFVLGDNSLISGDARYWNVPIELPADRLFVQSGRVPGRFMLGRAFFVYWPAGFRPATAAPALAPNFGEMRFIR